jgi:RNA recognition motif-containing protein
MSKKLFVGNLPYGVTKEKLQEVFSAIGELEESTVIVDKFTGRSKGFGFVTFKNDADADKAIADLNGKDIGGRAATVNEAKPMSDAPRERRGGFGGGRGGGRGGFGGGRGRFQEDY